MGFLYTVFDAQQFIVMGKVAIAMLLGAVIGFEREVADKPAGLRTHMLVCGAAAMLLEVGKLTTSDYLLNVGAEVIRADAIRVIAAIITGVSFLGAGTIIRQGGKGEVEGLTTAASLLIASSVGIAVALSQWLLAVGVTLLILIVLRLIPAVQRRLIRM